MDIEVTELIVRNHIIKLTGRVDAYSVLPLKEARDRLFTLGAKRIVLDLRNVTFLDSTGISLLVTILKRARTIGGDVILVWPTDPAAKRIMTLTRFDQIFRTADTLEEAIQ